MFGRASLPSMSPPQASELSRKYRLDREVARGAYGVVYRATNNDTGDAVAVKVVVDKQGRCEGRELYFLKHVQGCEFIVKLHDGMASPFWTAIVTDMFQCSLRQYHRDLSIVQPEHAATIASHLAQAVSHIHSRQVLHRDLHAGNVLLRFRGSKQCRRRGSRRAAPRRGPAICEGSHCGREGGTSEGSTRMPSSFGPSSTLQKKLC